MEISRKKMNRRFITLSDSPVLWHIASGLDIRLSELFRRVEDEIERHV